MFDNVLFEVMQVSGFFVDLFVLSAPWLVFGFFMAALNHAMIIADTFNICQASIQTTRPTNQPGRVWLLLLVYSTLSHCNKLVGFDHVKTV
mgnify:CR=1 FL=1